MPSDNLSRADELRRHALFGISIVLTAIGVFANFGSEFEANFVGAVCLKSGVVLFMLWLALPQLAKLNYWAILPILAVSLIAIFRPQLIMIAGRAILPLAPFLFVLWLLWVPKKKPKSR